VVGLESQYSTTPSLQFLDSLFPAREQPEEIGEAVEEA
jgi:hypothetical protein